MAAFNQTHWMITRDVEHYYETLQKTEWLSPRATRELQDEKLRRLIRQAYRNVPYDPPKLTETGVGPTNISAHADLGKLRDPHQTQLA